MEVWAALASLIVSFTLTVALWVRLKRSSFSGESVFLRLPEYCLAALLRISMFDRTQTFCRIF